MAARLRISVGIAVLLLAGEAQASEVGRRSPPEPKRFQDAVTGATVTALTTGLSNDAKIYQTHPQWTAEGGWIVFRSADRAADRTAQAFAVHETSGDIVQLTDGPGVQIGSLNVARRSQRLYYIRKPADGRSRLIELDLNALLADSAAGRPSARGYERTVAELPADYREAGGFTLDADERTAYLGVDLQPALPRPPGQPVPQVPGGIRALDLATGAYRKVIDTPFRMGHVQANPWVPGEILYCHETGGDAPQRMWVVRADGTGNRPLFKEAPEDWVTHEVFVDKDHVVFNLMGHTPELRRRPTGILSINLRSDEIEPIGQTSGRGYWHSDATPDGHLAAGDTFDGEVHLIDRASGARTVLTTGHRMRPDHTHPNFSPDGRRILVQSGLLSGGTSLDIMVIDIPEAGSR